MNLLDVQTLCVTYRQTGFLRRGNAERRVLSDVSFSIAPGESLGLVGESGCGKSTLAKALLGLAPISSGDVFFDGKPLNANLRNRRHFQEIQMVFQDPYNSLNPRMSVESIISEPLQIQRLLSRTNERRNRVIELLDAVGLGAADLHRYPHQLSGGQRQRIGIARALASNPRLLICDEPVSALDVSVQAQVMNLLRKLQRERQLSYLFIGHDLAVVEYISDRIIVMESGRIVETGLAETVCLHPQNPYTKRLVEAARVE